LGKAGICPKKQAIGLYNTDIQVAIGLSVVLNKINPGVERQEERCKTNFFNRVSTVRCAFTLQNS
jgi:hypothetical protein